MQQVELDKAEHPWMRPSKVEGDLSKEERETERLFRKLQGILNKLTAQRFQTLAEQALRLKIDSQQKLIGCADRIIANVYTHTCLVMPGNLVRKTMHVYLHVQRFAGRLRDCSRVESYSSKHNWPQHCTSL